MSLRDTFLNMLVPETPEVQKTNNAILRSARDFLRTGNREPLYPSWADIKMPDQDMYRGYSYAVIQKRGNKVASLAKNNIKTWANPDVVDEYQKRDEEVIHPYLNLISDSTKFTEKQFWKNISIYLDLAGRYYLGVIRSYIPSQNPKFPDITTDPTEFIMLNPYEIKRVVNKDGNVAGYIERKKDGRYREWPLYQIIEMRELNPFDPENSHWAMTDAAKEAVYTMNQSGDYTRSSLNGNINAPGIITTDVLLNDEDFANFRARMTQHTKGEPIFGNGTGAIKWDAMQIDLDKAALMDINEINRTTLFAVSGTSKTSLGIEQSGTTRETARVQSEQFISDTAQPRLEDIVDFLNLDYKKYYTREYKKTGYYIEIKSAVGRDYETDIKATQLKQSQFQLALQLIQAGYTEQSAYQFAEGNINFEDLELEKGLDKPKNPENPEEGEASTENSPNSPNNGPQSGSGSGNDNNPASEQNSLETANNEVQSDNAVVADLNELIPHSELNSLEDENSLPLAHNEGCTCGHNHKVETFINEVQEDEGKVVKNEYDKFLQEIREIEKETVDACARKVDINAFEESDIIGQRKKAKLIEKLKNAIHSYWWVLFPLFANNSMKKRNEEFDENVSFVFNNELQDSVDDNALRVAEGHMTTILNDVLEASNRAYTNVREEAAAELIIKAYEVNSDNYKGYFDHKPTMADALASIRKTDILEKNRRIYEKANKMAFDGYDRRSIIKAIRDEYKDISEKRATLIAGNETSRAFTHSQYESDKQFLNSIGKMEQAYKVMYSRRPASEQDKICAFCQALIDETNANPIPFEQPFLKYGESMEVVENGKVKIFTANYEDIEGGCNHPNCYERTTQVYTNEGWKRVDELTGKELFWSIDPETKKPEWVKAKAKIEGYAETLLKFQNKNFDMVVTKDHNMYVESKHRIGEYKIGKREFRPHLKEAQKLAESDRFYAGVVWEGENPEFIKLGNYTIPAELYCKFMGYYLSEGSANYYDNKNGKYYQGGISQETHHNKFWEVLEKMPFKVWNGEKTFTFTDESVVKYCMQFGKCHEKYIPAEMKQLSPRLLRIFIDAFVLGDGSRKYSAYSNAWNITMFTSSVKLRDDLTEVIQKAGYRPTIKLMSLKGTQYKGTSYKSNHDIWKISICNKVYAHNRTIKCEEIEYHDKVYCVELEKNHTLWTMRNGKCWWSGNCQCSYKLVFKNAQGEFVKTLNYNDKHDPETGRFAEKSASERAVLERYVRGDGMDVNRVLRGEIESDPIYEEEIELLKKATDKELGEEKEVWRSVDASSIFGDIDEITWEKLEGQIVYSDETSEAQNILQELRDKTLTEKGFMSTSTDKNVAMDWQDFTGANHPIVLHMTLPKTAKGIDIAKDTDLEVKDDPQREILLKAGTKYKIKDFKNEDGQILVEAEFIENSFGNEEFKFLNGGTGSGNFGHSGRPGLVGGSSNDKLASSSSRTRSFILGDTVKISSKGKEYVGVLTAVTSARTSEIEIELPSGKNFKMNVQTATLVQENGEQVILPFYNVKMVKNVDAVETTPEDRRTEKQREALDEVSKMIKISDKELAYLKNNCSEDSAIALRDELKRAIEDGIDLSNVNFVHNSRLTRTQGKVVYQPYTTGTRLPELELQMSSKWIADGEYYKQKQQKNYDEGWHTSSEIAGILRHELGHIKSAQIVLRQFDASREQTGKRILTSSEVAYRNESLCRKIVKKVNSGYSPWSLSHGKKTEGKDISDYAVKDGKYSEVVAESYSNSDFSEVTKNIAKQLDKEFKQRNNEMMMKIENELTPDDWNDSLCTGYPMSKEDWEVLHDKKPKEYVPDNIKINER